MAPALRRSYIQRWREPRRSYTGFKIGLFCGAIVCTCFLLTMYELSRYGYLTMEDGREMQRASLPRLQTAGHQSALLQSHNPTGSSSLRKTVVKRDGAVRRPVDTSSPIKQGVQGKKQRKEVSSREQVAEEIAKTNSLAGGKEVRTEFLEGNSKKMIVVMDFQDSSFYGAIEWANRTVEKFSEDMVSNESDRKQASGKDKSGESVQLAKEETKREETSEQEKSEVVADVKEDEHNTPWETRMGSLAKKKPHNIEQPLDYDGQKSSRIPDDGFNGGHRNRSRSAGYYGEAGLASNVSVVSLDNVVHRLQAGSTDLEIAGGFLSKLTAWISKEQNAIFGSMKEAVVGSLANSSTTNYMGGADSSSEETEEIEATAQDDPAELEEGDEDHDLVADMTKEESESSETEKGPHPAFIASNNAMQEKESAAIVDGRQPETNNSRQSTDVFLKDTSQWEITSGSSHSEFLPSNGHMLERGSSALLKEQETVQDGHAADVQFLNQSRAPESVLEFSIPRTILDRWKPPKECAKVEEMGSAAVGNTRSSSLRVRSMIQLFIADHGAERVAALPGAEFCKRGFVLGQGQEDGFGNNMYKVLTAAGLAVMLNRSLIIGERGATNPAYVGGSKKFLPAFGDYLVFSNQSFTMQEVKHLWARHGCAGKYKRPLVMHVDDIELGPGRSKCLCDDWTAWPYPIIWFKGTTDTVALQFLLKNTNPTMRTAAAKLLGNPAVPSSRPNSFGELFRAFVAPHPDIQEAVQWALKRGPDPDISLHLRMRHSRTKPAPAAASSCIRRLQRSFRGQLPVGRRPRVVVVSDTPAVYHDIEHYLGRSVEILQFDYMAYLKAFKNLSEVMSLNHGQPPRNRMKDWGEMPRWVALVDFFLAVRARVAVVSGAYKRVSTTYAQLIASLAAAYTLEEGVMSPSCVFYSSFQPSLVAQGLMKQSGWGHAWRPFGGKLGCRNQAPQCARTPLLPYAWWDGPWASPTTRDVRKMQSIGIHVDETGQVSEQSLDKFCQVKQKSPLKLVKLTVPTCTKEKPCEIRSLHRPV